MGDKTQLIALLLAARFQKPAPIISGILCATLCNHFIAGLGGMWLSHWLQPPLMQKIVAILFFLMGIWMLVPDKVEKYSFEKPGSNIFLLTLITFFLAEIGDKTQIATLTLAAHYQALYSVVIGTTLGMLLADIPAVYIGSSFAKKLPLSALNKIAACLFIFLGMLSIYSGVHYN